MKTTTATSSLHIYLRSVFIGTAMFMIIASIAQTEWAKSNINAVLNSGVAQTLNG